MSLLVSQIPSLLRNMNFPILLRIEDSKGIESYLRFMSVEKLE